MKRTGKAWIAMVAAMLIVMSSSIAMAGTFDGWDYRMKITFSGYEKPEPLTNFPMLVVLSTNIDGFLYSDFESASGADLRFADSNETTELNYEIEEWDTNASSYVWVQVPELESTNDCIYAYWGGDTNAPAYTTNGVTWSNGYIGVWHMSQTNAQDSTANGHHGSAQGAVLNVSSGAIGRANEFDADVDYISVPDSDDFTLLGDYSVSAWINSDDIGVDYEGFVGTYNGAGFIVFLLNDANNTLTFWDGASRSSDTLIPDGEWKHVVYTRKGTAGIFYIDGTNVKTRADAQAGGNGGDLHLGAGGESWASYIFDGTVDEVRISSIARSSNWVWACWMNQGSNEMFIGYGAAGPNTTNLTVLTYPASNIGVTNAVLNGKVWRTGEAENPYVYFCWDYTDQGTNSTSNWAHVDYMGTNWGKGELFATNLTCLLSGSNYSYRCYVTNSTGEDWSDDAQSFSTIHLPAVTNIGATNVFRDVATLRGEITDTGLDAPYVWFYYWIDGNSSTSPVTMGLQSGTFSEQVSGLAMGTNYTYWILASNMAGTVWSDEKSFQTLPFGTGTNIWTGEGVTDDWFEFENWSAGGVPIANEHVVITNVATEILLTNSTPDLASFLITNATLTFTNWDTTLNASNVTIGDSGQLTLPSAFTESQMSNRVHIVCTNFILEIGGEIDANGKGYAVEGHTGQGPGHGVESSLGGSGGGYGGKGGNGGGVVQGGTTYGSANAPIFPGSSGGGAPGYGYGGNGGGAVRIEAGGIVTVYGAIMANGQTGSGTRGSGGSGGGIHIICDTFGGSTNGVLSVNGANGTPGGGGGGGGGGRIAVQYQNLQGTLSVRFSASPGSGYAPYDCRKYAELGTLYFPNTNMLGAVLTDMSGYLFASNWTSWAPAGLTISNGQVGFEKGFQLNIGGDLLVAGTNAGVVLGREEGVTNSELTCGGNMVLTNGGSLTVYTGQTNGLTVDYGALVSVTGNMWIGSNSWVYPYSDGTNGGSVLFRMNNLVIATNAGFNADGKGYVFGGYGPGAGVASASGGSGAGYGGKGGDGGGAQGGTTYGSTNAPIFPGSSSSTAPGYGWGAGGGGAVRVEAAEVVTVYGTITANGENTPGGNQGGGSGGGIFIMCKEFDGSTSGLLSANGGNGQSTGGGGGGGRIAVWYGVPENRWEGIRDGNDMRRVSIITNASDYLEFSGTVSVTNGIGWTNLPPDCAYPGTVVFLTVTPPSGTMFMCQ